MTYALSLIIQLGAIAVAIAIVLLLIRQRPHVTDETEEALNRLREEILQNRELVVNALDDRTARTAAEHRQLLVSRAEQLKSELSAYLNERLNELGGRLSPALTETQRRTQESAGHLAALIHRYDEMSERLLDAVNRRLDAVTCQVTELRQQVAGHEQLPRALEDLTTQLAQLVSQVSAMSQTVERAEVLLRSRTSTDESQAMRERLNALDVRLSELVAQLEQRRNSTPRLPDYGQLAATDAIPLPPES